MSNEILEDTSEFPVVSSQLDCGNCSLEVVPDESFKTVKNEEVLGMQKECSSMLRRFFNCNK